MALTDLSFLDIDATWPPPEEAERLDAYAANRKLFEGDHDKVFNQWYRLLREQQDATLEIILNWPKRLSTLWADLIVGEPPRFSVGERDSAEQERLHELLTDTHYSTKLYEAVIDTSRYGDAVFKVVMRDGKADAVVQAPYYWFPVTTAGDVRMVKQHVLAFTYDKSERSPLTRRKNAVTYLKVEVHDKGRIEHRLYRLSKGRIAENITDSRQLQEDFPDLPGVIEETGVDDFLIQHSPGIRGSDRLFGLDDYKDVEGVLQEAEVRLAQISRVLDSHADPKMFGPPSALQTNAMTGEVEFVGGAKYFPVVEGETPPGYITWVAELQSAFQQLEVLIEQFYLISETSPAAFGQMDVGLATSGTALRRLMQAPLAKAARIRMRLDPVARRVIELMGELEDANSFEVAPPLEGVQATWNDGLPDDEAEQTSIEVQRVSAGISSKFSSIKRLDGVDDDQAEAELERIANEGTQDASLAAPEAAANGSGTPARKSIEDILVAQAQAQAQAEQQGTNE